MAEGIGLAASIIAIIDVSAKVARLCHQYSIAVGNARADITRIQNRVDNVRITLQGVQQLLGGPNSQTLPTSQQLLDSIDGCASVLFRLQSRLDPQKAGQNPMRRFWFRALKWPFDSKAISTIISDLESHQQTICLALHVDNTTLLHDHNTILRDIRGTFLQDTRQNFDASTARKPCFIVPFDRDPDFVDRPDIMAWIKKQYTGSTRRMALMGIGGFGKSQIAIQFAYHIHDTSPQTSVLWVHASSKSRFEEAYRSIAKRLQLPGRDDPGVDVLGLVRDWLQRDEAGLWLMILDNVDNVNLFYPSSNASARGYREAYHSADENPAALNEQRPLAAFLPKCRNGAILVTSRSMDAAEKLTGCHSAICRISAMDQTQALQLFRNKLEGDLDHDTATDLLRALDYIPLAITQAAAYINRRAPRISAKTYLEALHKSDKKKGNLLNSDAGDLRRDETVSNSVVTTWQVTFEQIRSERPSAANLLSFMSFFNPQGIPECVLYEYKGNLTENVDMDGDSDEFEDDLDVLRGYSLVSVTAMQGVCEMHSLVQFCTRAWLSVVSDAERWKWKFLRTMARHFPHGAFENWSTCQMLLPHVDSMLEEEPPDEHLQEWAYLLTNYAWYMFTTGNYRAAITLGEKAFETRNKMLGEQHPDTLTSISELASTYRKQGRWKEAEELQTRVMATRKTILGEEHPDTLTSISNLALTNRNQGRWKEAEELQVRVMEARKTILGEEHLHTLTSMNDLALTYRDQGRWKEAEELQVRVARARKTILGEEHPDTLSSINDLALTHHDQGRLTEAEELQVQVMETRKTIFGEEHPDTLTSINNLAITYKSQGRQKEAEGLWVQVMETWKKILGEEHPHTLIGMSNLASTFYAQGRWKEAKELWVRVVEARKTILGEEHPRTLLSMRDLALTYSSQRWWKEAEELRVRVVKAMKTVLGEEHPHTLISMLHLASTYHDQGRWKEAEELQVRVMEAMKTVLGEEHPDTLTSINNLAITYKSQGRWKEAEELQVRVMERWKTVLGEEHLHTLISRDNLASIHHDQGRWKEAEELQVRVMEIWKRVLGEEHPHTLSSMLHLASTYHDQGRWKKAEELQVRVMEAMKTVLGEEHPHTLASMNDLALTYNSQGRWKEAEELLVRVVKARKTILGEEHPHTLSSMNNLALTYHDQGQWKEAEQLQVRVMEARKAILGEEHPDTLTTINILASTWKQQGRSIDALALMRGCVALRERVLDIDHPDATSSAATLVMWES